jgi:hypothetical protein
MISPFWHGKLDSSPYLSPEEKRLSVALGIVTTTAVFLGFIVHFWGVCWILLGAFAGIRANLVEAVTLRYRAARELSAQGAVQAIGRKNYRFEPRSFKAQRP